MQSLDHRARRAAGYEPAVPAHQVIVGIARFGDRGHIRQRGRAGRAADGERAQLAGAYERERPLHRREGPLRLARHRRGDGARGALVRHVQRLRIGDRGEQHAGEVAGRADAGRSHVERVRLRFHQRDELGQRGRGQRRIHDQQHLAAGEERHRHEIGERIVGELLVGVRRDRDPGRGADEHRVAVGRRLRRRFRADDAARARAVVDHQRLSERLAHFRRDEPRQYVGCRARRLRQDDADRLRRIVLRQRSTCREDNAQHGQPHLTPPG